MGSWDDGSHEPSHLSSCVLKKELASPLTQNAIHNALNDHNQCRSFKWLECNVKYFVGWFFIWLVWRLWVSFPGAQPFSYICWRKWCFICVKGFCLREKHEKLGSAKPSWSLELSNTCSLWMPAPRTHPTLPPCPQGILTPLYSTHPLSWIIPIQWAVGAIRQTNGLMIISICHITLLTCSSDKCFAFHLCFAL